jgi:hypothetical protein
MLGLMSVSDANNLVSSFNWQNPSWDLFIILAWGVASLMYAFSTGRGRSISLLFSLYIAKLMVLEAPWLNSALDNRLPSTLSSMQQLVSFLIIFVLLFLLLSRYAFRTAADSRRLGSIAFVLVFSVLQVGLLINTILTYLAISGKTFSPLISFMFISDAASFIWVILPLVFLVFLGRSVSEHHE